MIYFDNAATTGVKPVAVTEAVMTAMRQYSVNPGRGGYESAKKCAEVIYGCRKDLSSFFGADDETAVIFTQNCTAALNTVLKGVPRSGDRVLVSSMEHNSVMRPLYSLRESGVITDVAEVILDDPEATVRSFERLIRPETKLVCCTHASNVTGHIMPIKEIGELCRRAGVRFLVDAAQTAGVVGINMREMNIDYLCIAGHKGLYAPSAIGVLIALAPIEKTLVEGGTGTNSIIYSQPPELPERFESGTVSVPLIFGLKAGLGFVRAKGASELYKRETALAAAFYDRLTSRGGVTFYSGRPAVGYTVPTVSFNVHGLESSLVAEKLGNMGICVRAGLHCAPSAHRTIGTEGSGTVRASFSAFNTMQEVARAAEGVSRIIGGAAGSGSSSGLGNTGGYGRIYR